MTVELRKTAWHYKAQEVRLGEKAEEPCWVGKNVLPRSGEESRIDPAHSHFLLSASVSWENMPTLGTGGAYQPLNLSIALLIQNIAELM